MRGNKLTFKRLRKHTLVYDYCKEKIKKGDTFTISDISKDLKMSRTSVIEYLQEISNRYNDITYSGGVITLIGVGNSIGNNNSRNNEGLTVKKLPRSTYSRQQKKIRVYNYLVDLVNQGKKIPCLSYLSKDFTDMHLTTLMEVLKQLDKENKIIYKRGQVVAVNVPNVIGNREKTLKYNNGENIKEEKKEENDTMELREQTGFVPLCSTQEMQVTGEIDTNVLKDTFSFRSTEPAKVSIVSIDTSKFDKAVKDLIAEYILNANITTREEIVEYVDSIMKITDKLKNKLY